MQVEGLVHKFIGMKCVASVYRLLMRSRLIASWLMMQEFWRASLFDRHVVTTDGVGGTRGARVILGYAPGVLALVVCR
jgi:hypothetical protein